MRKIIAYEYLTLDDVMEAPEKWQFPYLSDDVAESIKAQILDADAILLGRVTYEIFAASWPSRTNNEFGVADKLNSAPKYVVSTTLEKADWNNTTLIKGNVAAEISKLKQQPGGNIVIVGSGQLLDALMRHDLIDEYRLMLHPVVLGSGKRLFADGVLAALQLVEAKPFSSGVLLLRYQPRNSQ
jgi:dihydrofolate reductase